MLKAESGVFRTSVFANASLADAHRFCELGCRRDDCCDGFVVNRNSLNGGTASSVRLVCETMRTVVWLLSCICVVMSLCRCCVGCLRYLRRRAFAVWSFTRGCVVERQSVTTAT